MQTKQWTDWKVSSWRFPLVNILDIVKKFLVLEKDHSKIFLAICEKKISNKTLD